MGLCSECAKGIQEVRPQNHPYRGPRRLISVNIRRYNRKVTGTCFLCSKLARWLEATASTSVLRKWKKSSLRVWFYLYAKVGYLQLEERIILPCTIAVVPPDHREEDIPFTIDLNFISIRDFLVPLSYGPSHPGFDFDLIRRWLNDCTQRHERCGQSMRHIQPWYPTRLLRVGSSVKDVKLVVTAKFTPRGPYTTLSHRWGDHIYMKLQTETEAEFERSIDVSHHPEVFRHAMAITRALGIDYIWIDSLCIKQDENLEDWKVESLKMHQVYSYSYVNISATLSRDGTESLLQTRSWTASNPSSVELDMGGDKQSFYVLDDDIWADEIENAPLNSRGWVFQERYLAPRILHFGQNQMAWECNELRTLEMFPSGPPSRPGITGMNTPHPDRSGRTPGFVFRDEWRTIAERYSKCAFTRHTDKLVALAGVARFVEAREAQSNITHGTYAAGMWENTMVYDLAWSRAIDDVERFPIASTAFRAPSWSWISVDGEITFPTFFQNELRFHFAKIINLREEVFDHGNGAMVSRGVVEISGMCLPLTLRWLEGKVVVGMSIMRVAFSTFIGSMRSELELEISSEEAKTLGRRGRLLFLPLIATTYDLYGIILTKTRGVGAHRRLGAVNIPLAMRPQGPIGRRGTESHWTSRPGKEFMSQTGNMGWSGNGERLIALIVKRLRKPRNIRVA